MKENNPTSNKFAPNMFKAKCWQLPVALYSNFSLLTTVILLRTPVVVRRSVTIYWKNKKKKVYVLKIIEIIYNEKVLKYYQNKNI